MQNVLTDAPVRPRDRLALSRALRAAAAYVGVRTDPYKFVPIPGTALCHAKGAPRQTPVWDEEFHRSRR